MLERAPSSFGADTEGSFTKGSYESKEGNDARTFGGDPMREAFNRLASVIDFQAQQQVS